MESSNRNKIAPRPVRNFSLKKTEVSKLVPHSCRHGCYFKIRNVIDRTRALEEKVDKLYAALISMLKSPLPAPGRTLLRVSPAAARAQSSSRAPSFELKGKKLVLRRTKAPEKVNDENRRTPPEEITVDSENDSEPPSPVSYKDRDSTDEGPSSPKKRRLSPHSYAVAPSLTPFGDEMDNEEDATPPPELDAQIGTTAPDSDVVDDDEGDDEEDELRKVFKSSKWLLQKQNWDSFTHPKENRSLTSDEVGFLVDRHILLGPCRATVGSFRDHYEEVRWTHKLDDVMIEASLRRLSVIGMLTNTNDVVFKKKGAESFGDFKKFSLLLAQRAIRLPEYQQTFLPGF